MTDTSCNLDKKRVKEEEVSDGEHSASKSARREEESDPPSLPSPLPSSEVEELRQKLRQSEEMYQKAYRDAREANERAERAEKQLLDSKPPVADWDGVEKELEKRLVDVTAQLGEARSNADLSNASKAQALRDNDALTVHIARLRSREEASIRVNTALEAKNAALESQLETARIAAEAARQNEINLTEEVNVVKQKLEALKSSEEFATRMKDHLSSVNADLKKQLEGNSTASVTEVPNVRETMSGKIADLENELNEMRSKLAIATGENDVLKQVNDAIKNESEKFKRKLKREQDGDRSRIKDLKRKLDESQKQLNANDDDFNIFQLCLPIPGKTVSLDDAQWKLRAKYVEFEKRNDHSSFWSHVNIGPRRTLDCEACKLKVEKTGILSHFLSTEHALKARNFGAAVSLPAVLHWERVLNDRRRRASDARAVDDRRRGRSSESQAKADSKK